MPLTATAGLTVTTYIDANKSVVSQKLTDYAGRTVTESVNGNVKATYEYYANGQVGSVTDAKGNTAEYEYGFLGLPTEVRIPFNSVNERIARNTYYSNGQLKTTSQNVQAEDSATEKWSTTEYEYNSQGLLSTVILGNPGQPRNYTYHFYNQDGVKTEMYTGLNSPLTSNSTGYLTTSYEYDNWNRPVNTTDSTGYNSGSAEYDLNGNAISSVNANGYVTTNTYDALNRPLKTSVETGESSKNVTQTFTYDNMGRLSYATNNGRTTSYEYDGLGRVIFENNYGYVNGYTYVGNTNAKASVFSGINNLLTYGTTYYEYDDEMRLSSVTGAGGASAEYTYDANGNRESMTYGNGITVDYEYNFANLETSVINRNGNDVISQFDYIYNLDGSEACNVRTEDGIIENTEYQYDHLQRLTSEIFDSGSAVDTISYTFDDFNNRASMVVTGTENYTTTYNYKDAIGKYTALLQSETKVTGGVSEGTSYTYDAAGSQITKTDVDGKVQENIYNAFNQLLGVNVDNSEIASYGYNYAGLRDEKKVGGQTVGQIWVGGQITVDADGYNAACYIRGAGLIAAQDYSYGQFTNEPVYYLFDAHGNVVNLISNDGEKIKTYRYDAFGVEKNPDPDDTNPFRYCGEYFDKETGTIYLRARSYDPSIGRFTTRDSYTGQAGDPLSLNLYTYCINNPVLYVDPSGHSYGTLPNGEKMSINSAWDAEKFKEAWGGRLPSQKEVDAAKAKSATINSGGSSSKIPTTPSEKISTLITTRQLESVFYNMDGYTISWAGVSDETVQDLNRVLNKYDITTTERIAQFIGQCSIESHCGDWLTKLGSESYLKGHDYYPYYGAGYIQLTWESNYAAFSKDMNDPKIMEGPTYVAENYAWEAAGWFWNNTDMNSLIDNGASVYDVTQVVRGYDRDTWQMREQAYNNVKTALG